VKGGARSRWISRAGKREGDLRKEEESDLGGGVEEVGDGGFGAGGQGIGRRGNGGTVREVGEPVRRAEPRGGERL
jgi:hypothetical protein